MDIKYDIKCQSNFCHIYQIEIEIFVCFSKESELPYINLFIHAFQILIWTKGKATASKLHFIERVFMILYFRNFLALFLCFKLAITDNFKLCYEIYS